MSVVFNKVMTTRVKRIVVVLLHKSHSIAWARQSSPLLGLIVG